MNVVNDARKKENLHSVENSENSLTIGARDRGKRVRLYSSLKSFRSSFGKRR